MARPAAALWSGWTRLALSATAFGSAPAAINFFAAASWLKKAAR